MRPTDKRMTSERCAFLSFVAIAHKLEEAWICFFPVLPLMYISQYLPTIGKRFVDHRQRHLYFGTNSGVFLYFWKTNWKYWIRGNCTIFFSREFNTWDRIYGILPKDTLRRKQKCYFTFIFRETRIQQYRRSTEK